MDDFFDEDGEQLMDPDARSPSPERQAQPYDGLEDDLDDDGADWNRDRSPTPVHGGDDGGSGSSSRPRKRLLKKGGGGKGDGGGMPADDLEDWGEDAAAGLADDDVDLDADAARKRKGSSSLRDLARGGGKEKHEKKGRRRSRSSGIPSPGTAQRMMKKVLEP